MLYHIPFTAADTLTVKINWNFTPPNCLSVQFHDSAIDYEFI